MKKIYLLIAGLLLAIGLQGQAEKTLELTSGTLTSLLTEQEKNTITSLTLTGTVDARDFITTSQMPLLTSLDLSQTRVTAIDTLFDDRVAISHPDTIGSYGYNPKESGSLFSDRLTNLRLPSTIKAIDINGLKGCSGLTAIEIPPTVTFIGLYAFWGCTGLTSLNIPSSVTYIETYAFNDCSGLRKLIIPPSVTSINPRTFALCSSLDTLTIPSSVKSIDEFAFTGCTALTTVILPESFQGLNHGVFMYCPNISSIYSYNPIPPGVASGAFDTEIYQGTVYVPYGSKALYAAAEGWKEFQNIVETLPGFTLSATSLTMEAVAQSTTIELNAQTAWTATSDQAWLTVSPLSGTGSQTLTLTANENTTNDIRTAKVTVSVSDTVSKDITVVQAGKLSSDTIHVETAGTLYTYLNEDELANLIYLTLTGEIDARDFKLIRDRMPLLEVLDIREVNIVAYTDTTFGNNINHPEDAIPFGIFEWNDSPQTSYALSGHSKLKAIKLPNSLKKIGYRAFFNCPVLTTVEMQASVENLGNEAFSNCTSLTSVNLPASVTQIGEKAFQYCGSLPSLELPSALKKINVYTFGDCKALESIAIPSSVTYIESNAFTGCSALQSVDIPDSVTVIRFETFKDCSSLSSVVIPPHVTRIEEYAFYRCSALQTLTLPASLTTIRPAAFAECTSLDTIYCYAVNPPAVDNTGYTLVFDNVDKASCMLFVPFGTRVLYASANQWKDFQHIVEMGEFSLDATTVTVDAGENSEAMVKLHTSLAWTATSDQEWLTVAPGSGRGDQELTLTAEANPLYTARTALVTIAADAMNSITITVTQHGMAVGLDEMGISVQVNLYPNPFTQQLTIEVANSSSQAVSVEIFTIGGLKIKTLPTAPKKAKTSVSWNGKDDQGKKVPGGMYLLKVNGEVRKVVRE